jgi:hypothetical protein
VSLFAGRQSAPNPQSLQAAHPAALSRFFTLCLRRHMVSGGRIPARDFAR